MFRWITLQKLSEFKSIIRRLFLQCNEIRKIDSNLIVIGKSTVDIDKEDFDNDADDDDEADNAEESEGDEFEQETGWSFFFNTM